MFKADGRAKPADKQEVAKVIGKVMICPKCGAEHTLTSTEFATTKCFKCREANLIDKN